MFTDSPLDAYIISGNTVLQHSFVFSPTTSVLLTQFCIAKMFHYWVLAETAGSLTDISGRLIKIIWTSTDSMDRSSSKLAPLLRHELLFSSLFVAIDLLKVVAILNTILHVLSWITYQVHWNLQEGRIAHIYIYINYIYIYEKSSFNWLVWGSLRLAPIITIIIIAWMCSIIIVQARWALLLCWLKSEKDNQEN